MERSRPLCRAPAARSLGNAHAERVDTVHAQRVMITDQAFEDEGERWRVLAVVYCKPKYAKHDVSRGWFVAYHPADESPDVKILNTAYDVDRCNGNYGNVSFSSLDDFLDAEQFPDVAAKLEEWREQWPLSPRQLYVAEQFTVHGMIVPPSLVRQNIPIKKRFGEGNYTWAKRKAVNERWAFTKALYEFHGREYPAEYPEVEEAFQEPGSDPS